MRNWTETTNVELAKLTGLTDLDLVANDPERLELQARLIRSKIENGFAPGCPPRYRIAADLYRDRADELLERVHDD